MNIVLAQHLAGTVAPSDAVAECLRVLCAKPIPNTPLTGAQGSLRMSPADFWLYAYGEAHGLLPATWEERMAAFIDYEEAHRHLSSGGPAEAGYNIADAQHFELLPHAFIALNAKDAGLRQLAAAQTSALIGWAHAWAQKYAASEVNARALLWPASRAALVIKLNLALGVHDDRPLAILKAVMARLKVTADEDANGCAWLTLNNNADPDDSGDGDGQKDHDWCRVSDWMNGGRGLAALGTALDVLPLVPGVPPEFVASVRKMFLHAARAKRYAMGLAETQGALPGGSVDDYDPTPAGDYYVHALPDGSPKWDGTMIAFSVAGMLATKRHAAKHWTWIRPRLEAYYARSNRYAFNPKKAGSMDQHSAAVACLLAAEFGWKVAP